MSSRAPRAASGRHHPRAAPVPAAAPTARGPGPPTPVPVGNHALTALLAGRVARTEPGDPVERQADRLARGGARLDAAVAVARLHTGPVAAALTRAYGVRALTAGRDVVLGEGAYAPGTPAGRLLLRHELVHVLQHATGPGERTVGGERLVPAGLEGVHGNGPIGPIAPRQQDSRVAEFERRVHSAAKQRLRMSSAALTLWSGYLATAMTGSTFQAHALATGAQELYRTARSTGSEAQFEQWSRSDNPAMREVLENQMHGRWRACTGCHATVQADAFARTATRFGPAWEAPAERLGHLAGTLGGPASPGPLELPGVPPEALANRPGTAGTLGAVQRIRPALEQLGPSGYAVLPQELFTSLSGLPPDRLLARVQDRIRRRQQDYAELVEEIDAGDIDAFLFIPVVDELLATATPEVRAAVTAEMAARRSRERARGYAVGGAGLLALLLTVFPPTAVLGVALGVGAAAAAAGEGIRTTVQGTRIQQGRGAGVFSPEQEEQAGGMVAAGIFQTLLSAVDLVGGVRALRAASPGGTGPPVRRAAPAARRPVTAAPRPGGTVTDGPFTVTMSADGALFATHSDDLTAFLVVQGGVARGYRFRTATFELVGTRRLGAEPPGPGAAAPAPQQPRLLGPPAPPPVLPAGDLVWVNTRTSVFHEPGSAWFGRTRQGRYASRTEALAAGHRPSRAGTAAAEGTATHEMLKAAQRPFEGVEHPGGWTLEAVERTVGGRRRVDELWINHERRTVLVVDTYTGPREPLPHYLKGLAYREEPWIQQLLRQGYRYDYQTAFHHPSRRH